VAATAATWVSLRLVPADGYDIRWGALLRFLPHFLWQSVVAGLDVARRAFDPRMPLRPGFIAYPIGFRSSTACNTFTTITSLLPGTVPCGVEDGQLIYHCLDIDQPVAAELKAEEQRLATFIDEAPHA
jgi:multicomponent Na+:H+ antiporter subunit E